MLGAVFKVLGIIGIILLIILAIAILLILFVVIAPLKYKFIFNYDKDKEHRNSCYLKLNWLCHIVRCRIDIGLHGIDYELRLFGFKSRLLDKYLGKDDEDDTDEYEAKDNEFNTDDYNYNDYEDINLDNSSNDMMQDDTIRLIDEDYSSNSDSNNGEKDISEHEMLLDEIEEIWEDLISESEYEYDDYDEEDESKFSWKKIFRTNPVKLLIGYIKILIRRVKAFFVGVLNTINALLRKYELVVELWDKRSTQAAIEKIIDYVYRLGKHIKPKKTKIKLHYGFDDPAFTGQVLGAVGIVYGFVGDIIEVNPDFEEEKMEVDCLISGKMRVLNLGIIVIKVARDKVLKRLLKNIDKLKEDLKDDRQ